MRRTTALEDGRSAMPQYHCVLYGATGFSGRTIAQEARRMGISVLLAGRDAQGLSALARALEFDWQQVGLQDRRAIDALLANGPLVINASGPFTETAETVIRACLRTLTNYL